MPKKPEILSIDPKYLGDVVDAVRRVGQATGAESQADLLASRIEARIDAVDRRTSQAAERPRVLALEWVEPLICPGHWVPEMIELAGGTNCFGDKDTASFKLEWVQVVESQPDVIIFMPCGFDVKRTLQDVPLLAAREEWAALPAVRNNRVYVIDAGAYTSRAGPRLATGLEILAEMIHPELFSGMVPESGGLRLHESLVRA